MSRLSWSVILIAMIFQGCGSLENTSLNQIERERTYTVDKAKLLNNIKSFAISNEFRISVWEEQSGRVIGEWKDVGYDIQDPRSIIMNLDINPLDRGRCRILVDFSFRKSSGTIKQDDMTLLVDWYDKFFGYLDSSLK